MAPYTSPTDKVWCTFLSLFSNFFESKFFTLKRAEIAGIMGSYVGKGGETEREQRWAESIVLYCSVYRATWRPRPTSTPRRSTLTRRWLRPSRPATRADCRSSPAGRTLFPAHRRRGPAAPDRSRTCPDSGRATRRDSLRWKRRANDDGDCGGDATATLRLGRLCMPIGLVAQWHSGSVKHNVFWSQSNLYGHLKFAIETATVVSKFDCIVKSDHVMFTSLLADFSLTRKKVIKLITLF